MFAAHSTTLTMVTIAISLLIAISAGIEEIFRFGELWRDKRTAAELIKCEGFRYFQLSGPYKGMPVKPNDDLSSPIIQQLPVLASGSKTS